MSQAKPLNKTEIVTGDPTYYMVYTGPLEKLKEWLKSDKGKGTVIPILQTKPISIWCPNDRNAVVKLEKRQNELQGVSPDFPGSA